MDYLTSLEAAQLWGIGKCRVDRLAREGRIDGAVLMGKSWLIPKESAKPIDGRTRQAKNEPKKDTFRFPFFINNTACNFSPALNKEEKLLRNAEFDFYACKFKSAKKHFDQLATESDSVYIRIASLFYLCSLSIECFGGDDYGYYSARLQFELANDFPHKKDMSVVTPWLHTLTMQFQSVSENLKFDTNYDYAPSVRGLIAYLSYYHLSKIDAMDQSEIHFESYEMLCHLLLQDGYFYEACELHFALFLTYYVLLKQDEMLRHLKEGLKIVKEHHLFLIAASYEFYYQDAFDLALRDFPEDFVKTIKHNSNIISKSIALFFEKYNGSKIFVSLSRDDYRYLVFAYQKNSNMSVARALHISSRTVSIRYKELYQKLGVSGKQELVELCARLMSPQT